ncbi:hypothetical protein JCM10908_001356 [Rhodotorula pacifica]|uniref:phosphatidate phosphatase APP1 n=1 Tax=Rhodotorula pacifica TaxID=1495444 RepID=UPI00317DD0F1
MPPPPPPPPALPPRRPPPAAFASPSTAPTQAAPAPAPSSSTSMLRARALAKVNRIAATTHEYVVPRLDSAASSAATRLANWRDRDALEQEQERGVGATGAGGYAYQVRQPKKAATARATPLSSSAATDWSPSSPTHYTSSSRSISTTTTSAADQPPQTPSRKWTASGLGSYLNLSSYNSSANDPDSAPPTVGAASSSASAASTTTGSKGGKGKGGAVGVDDVDEDKILCFPGWATLQPSSHQPTHEPALVLLIQAHGYAYRQRPLSQASRSQRIFYALAKSFAALPKIPAHVAAAAVPQQVEEDVVPLTPTSTATSAGSADEHEFAAREEGHAEEALEKLLAVGGRAGDRAAEEEVLQEALVDKKTTTSEPDEMTLEERLRSPTARDFATAPGPARRSATAPPTPPRSITSASTTTTEGEDEKAILSTPAKLSRRPGFRIEIPSSPQLASTKRAGTTTSQPGSPTTPMRSPGLKSVAFNFVKSRTTGADRHHRSSSKTQDSYVACDHSGSRTGSKRSSAASSRASSRASSPVRTATPRLPPLKNSNNKTTLPPETWPSPFALPSDPSALPRLHTNLHTRLLPFFGLKLANRKIRLSAYPALGEGQLYDGVLATKVVRTSATSGGGFKTSLEVKGPELRKWLDLVGNGNGGSKSNGGGNGLDTLRVRIVAELLEPDPPVPSVVDTAPFSGVGIGSTATDRNAIATAVDEVELDVAIQGEGGEGGGVRIVSDVDDTIKWTEVTKGTKTIFRNVFVRELAEIRVPGMSSWYRSLQAHGAHFHYVSNSPIELWPVLRTFMKLAGFPNGSCTLKEYGGASSALAKLWEEPGQRKKANVEVILKEFPAARFILVGDSGEQDLELYVALARQYPSNILAIYIRDVTTPFDPIAANPANRHNHNKPSSHPYAESGFSARRASADEGGSHTTTTTARETSLPPEVTWKHTNSMDDLAGLIDDDALRFVAPNAYARGAGSRERPIRALSDMPDLPGQWDGPHERPVPVRRSSDSEAPVLQQPLHDDGKTTTTNTATSSAASSPTSSKRPPPHHAATLMTASPSSSPSPSPSTFADSPSLLSEPDSDPLSPNNPIRPSPTPSQPGLDPAVEAFYRRVAAAERSLPKGVILRLFRHGNECAEEALELVKTAGKRPFGS